jgi:hypothetical protein
MSEEEILAVADNLIEQITNDTHGSLPSSSKIVCAPPPLIPNKFLPGGKRKRGKRLDENGDDEDGGAELDDDGNDNNRNNNNTVKTFRAVYPNAKELGGVLAAIRVLATDIPLEFTKDGLRIEIVDSSHAMMMQITVPRSSFLVYENVLTKTLIVVPAKHLQESASLFTSDSTLTLFQPQTVDSKEPLGFQICPANGDRTTGIVETFGITPIDAEIESLAIPDLADMYQFRVVIPVVLLARKVKFYNNRASYISLSLTDLSFDIATSFVDETATMQTTSVPYIKGIQPKDTNADIHAKIGATGSCCYLGRLANSSREIKSSDITNFRLQGKFFKLALAQAPPGVRFLEIHFGRNMNDPARNFSPLRLKFVVPNSLAGTTTATSATTTDTTAPPKAGNKASSAVASKPAIVTVVYIAPRNELD